VRRALLFAVCALAVLSATGLAAADDGSVWAGWQWTSKTQQQSISATISRNITLNGAKFVVCWVGVGDRNLKQWVQAGTIDNTGPHTYVEAKDKAGYHYLQYDAGSTFEVRRDPDNPLVWRAYIDGAQEGPDFVFAHPFTAQASETYALLETDSASFTGSCTFTGLLVDGRVLYRTAVVHYPPVHVVKLGVDSFRAYH
jgi:hypothetical protein